MDIILALNYRELAVWGCFLMVIATAFFIVLNGNEDSPAVTLALFLLLLACVLIAAVS